MTLLPPRARPRARALVAAWAALVVAPRGAAAQDVPPDAIQGTVHAVSLAADLTTAPGVATLRVEYQLNDIRPGVRVPVSVLDFGDAVAAGFRIGAAGAAADLPDRHGAARRGSWPVEAGPDGRAVLTVSYQVPRTGEDGDGGIVSHLPVLIVDRAPEAARPGLFRGSVRVPPDWNVTEGFPTGLAGGGEPGVFSVELSVVPAVVTLRARTDGRRGVALPLVLDLVAAATLILTAVVGWRHMREPVL